MLKKYLIKKITVPKTIYLFTFRINCNIKRKQIKKTTMDDLLSKMKKITVQKKAIELYKPPKSKGNVCIYTIYKIIKMIFLFVSKLCKL